MGVRMELRHLRYFVAVAEAGSLTVARKFISGLLAVSAGTAASRKQRWQIVRGMQNLQKPYPLRFYGKS